MTDKEMLDEMRKKIVNLLAMESLSPYHIQADKILALETPTCRIAVVEKKGELPRGDLRGIRQAEWWSGYGSGYIEAQQDMIRVGYVQEVKDES